MSDKENILNLKNDDTLIILSEEVQIAKIVRKGNKWLLFRISLYDKTAIYVDLYFIEEIDKMINHYQSW